IGINGDKNWLPHYRAGFTRGGGDEFPKPGVYAHVRRAGAGAARELLKRGIGGPILRRLRAAENAVGLGDRGRNGNWWGNDTIWRTAIDLNKIFYRGDRDGVLGRASRRVLNVYDGIVAGEGDGPMAPDPRPLGLLVGGVDGVASDIVITWLMGFDWRRIPILSNAVGELAGGVHITGFGGDPAHLPVRWSESGSERELSLADIDLDLRFRAHPGWLGRIERAPHATAAAPSRHGTAKE